MNFKSPPKFTIRKGGYFCTEKRMGGELVDELVQWVNILSSLGVLGLMSMGLKKLYAYFDDKSKSRRMEHRNLHQADERLKTAIMSLLHHEIYDNCSIFLDRGYITLGELNDLEFLYTGYKDLGGNSTGELLYCKCKDLPVREDNNIKKEDLDHE